jgi:hypothetical protein
MPIPVDAVGCFVGGVVLVAGFDQQFGQLGGADWGTH